MFCGYVIKVDTYGYGAKSSTIHFEISCKYVINKDTTASYALQRERDGGMISQGIGWGVSQTPEP